MTAEDVLTVSTPTARLLGREVISVDGTSGSVTVRFKAQPEFLNRHGTVQGGMLAAMLDSATALSLYATLPPGHTGLTTNLNVTFLKPGKLGAFTATTRVISRDERNAQTEGELTDEDGVLVAKAIATLRIVARR